MDTLGKKCKYCDNTISSAAIICSKCGLAQKFLLSKALGESIPLIAATVSTLLLVGALVWPLFFPERAKIVFDTASPAYGLDELRLDIANLSDLAVLLPSEMYCEFRGEIEHLNSRMSEVSVISGGEAYSVLVLSRTSDSSIGLRNQSARVRYATPANEEWGAAGTRGRLNCSLNISDVHGDLDPIRPQVAFEINEAGIILYDIGNFVDAETMDVSAGLFFEPRNALIPTSSLIPESGPNSEK